MRMAFCIPFSAGETIQNNNENEGYMKEHSVCVTDDTDTDLSQFPNFPAGHLSPPLILLCRNECC